MIVEKAQAAMVNTPIDVAGAPTRGAATAKMMMVEVSDYHCPFCRRHTLTTQPQIDAEFINTGKLRYVFIDYPIDQLHPDAFKAHEAAKCAGEQGKYWEMHAKLFETPPTRDGAQLVPQLVAQAQAIGLDVAKFRACFDGGKHAAQVKDNVARMQALGIDSTPTFLIGLTPPPGQPMKVVKVVRGAVPFAQFKAAFDAVLNESAAVTAVSLCPGPSPSSAPRAIAASSGTRRCARSRSRDTPCTPSIRTRRRSKAIRRSRRCSTCLVPSTWRRCMSGPRWACA